MEIPDPEVLNRERDKDMSPYARAKRLILERTLEKVVRDIKTANAKNIFLIHAGLYDLRENLTFTDTEQVLITSLFPPLKKGREYSIPYCVSEIVRHAEAVEYIRVKLKAKSPLYRVKEDTECNVTISWVQ
jgi:hypothetical protein